MEPEPVSDFAPAIATAQRLEANIATVIKGGEKPVRWLLTAFLAGGHVLLEDVPGTGKTTLAKCLALSVNADFRRIQFTPDLLPTDILGVSVFSREDQQFRFRRGPIFTQVLLADEINRASPRTQSALLEAMGENQVSVDGESLPMQPLFFVMATQNPVEFHGTYPLPEAQLDRFALRFGLGYVSRDEEVAILDAQQAQRHPIERLRPCVSVQDVLEARAAAAAVAIKPELKRYIVDLVAATRGHPAVQLGASPRAALVLMKAAQALSLLSGSDYVKPEAIRELAAPVIAHRLAMAADARYSGASATAVVEEVVSQIEVPG